MLDIGFRPDIEKILRRCPQRSANAAAVAPPCRRRSTKLAQRYMRDPRDARISRPRTWRSKRSSSSTSRSITSGSSICWCGCCSAKSPQQAIVFCRTKRGTEKIFQRLEQEDCKDVACMHGDMQQGARDRVMADFRDGKVRAAGRDRCRRPRHRCLDASRTSSTTTFPRSATTTSIASAAPAAWAAKGSPTRSSRPEEGGELTRIEERINRLLKRDEIRDFEAVSSKVLADPHDALSPEEKAKAKAENSDGEEAGPSASPHLRPTPPTEALSAGFVAAIALTDSSEANLPLDGATEKHRYFNSGPWRRRWAQSP